MSSTPPLPSTLPPEHKIEIDEATSKEKWILNNEDIEVTQFLGKLPTPLFWNHLMPSYL